MFIMTSVETSKSNPWKFYCRGKKPAESYLFLMFFIFNSVTMESNVAGNPTFTVTLIFSNFLRCLSNTISLILCNFFSFPVVSRIMNLFFILDAYESVNTKQKRVEISHSFILKIKLKPNSKSFQKNSRYKLVSLHLILL